MKGIVPEDVLWRKAKAGGRCVLVEAIHEGLADVRSAFDGAADIAAPYFDRRTFEQVLRTGLHGRHAKPMRLILAMDVITWINELAERQLVVADGLGARASTDAFHLRPSTEPCKAP